MTRVHIFNWVTCAWEWVWRSANVVRAMRHLTRAMIPAVCAGIVIITPPTPPAEAHSPPPIDYGPPSVDIEVPPPTGSYPPAWGYSPPSVGIGGGGGGGFYPSQFPVTLPAIPIPTGPNIFPQSIIPKHTENMPTPELPPLCDVSPPSPLSPVSEPASILLLLSAFGLLLIWRKEKQIHG